MKIWPERETRYGISETAIVSYQGFTDLLSSVLLAKKENYIFRGHRKSSWLLESTLTRTTKLLLGECKSDNHLAVFKKSAVGRRGTNPKDLEDTEFWSVGQHFGLHTPLLDWTHSPFVALFFSFCKHSYPGDSTSHRVVAALNRQRIVKLCTAQDIEADFYFLEPLSEENHRLLNQSGLFTKLNENVDIETWLKGHVKEIGSEVYLLKIHILESLRDTILKHLNWMNINYLTLFPDLEGAAKHTNLKLELPGY